MNAAGEAPGVFINCPFDSDYNDKFQAIVFAIMSCGFTPRCALEVVDSGEIRIEKIMRLIDACSLGVHDISRTEPDPVHQLPRFNMPLELGLFLGATRFGGRNHKNKKCLILDVERFRYQKYISDIAGQDIAAHDGSVAKVIKALRDFLSTHSNVGIPGSRAIRSSHGRFLDALPTLCDEAGCDVDDITFSDFRQIVARFLLAPAD